jgi:RND family efflux transporter MFP subunit
MNKIYQIIPILLILVSCGGGKKDALTEKKNELEDLKSKIASLSIQADKLESEIKKLDTAGVVYKVDVSLDTIRKESYSNAVELQGVVESKKTINLMAEMGGVVSAVLVKQGSNVRAGQTLIRIDNASIQSQIAELKNALSLAQTTYERQSRLFKQNIGTEMQVLQAKNRVDDLNQKILTAQTMSSKYVVKAPYSGVIDDVMVSKGEMAAPGLPMLTLVNKSDNIIKIQASEKFVGDFKKGDKVLVKYPVLGLEALETIQTVGQNIDPGNRSFYIFIKPTKFKDKIKPNMLSIVEVSDFKLDQAIAIPTKLIYRLNEKRYVFVAAQDSIGKYRAVKKEVVIQKSFLARTIIASGLNAGDLIIEDGYQNVAEGDLLQIIN